MERAVSTAEANRASIEKAFAEFQSQTKLDIQARDQKIDAITKDFNGRFQKKHVELEKLEVLVTQIKQELIEASKKEADALVEMRQQGGSIRDNLRREFELQQQQWKRREKGLETHIATLKQQIADSQAQDLKHAEQVAV